MNIGDAMCYVVGKSRLNFSRSSYFIIPAIFSTAKAFECKDIKLAQVEIRTLHQKIEELRAFNENLTKAIEVWHLSGNYLIINLTDFFL